MRNRLLLSTTIALALHCCLWLFIPGLSPGAPDTGDRVPVMTITVLAPSPARNRLTEKKTVRHPRPATPAVTSPDTETPLPPVEKPATGEHADAETATDNTNMREASGPSPGTESVSASYSFSLLSAGIRLPVPPYPPAARRWGYEGTVRLRIFLDKNGGITDAVIISSSGYSILDKSAVDTVKKHWKFNSPGTPLHLDRDFAFSLR